MILISKGNESRTNEFCFPQEVLLSLGNFLTFVFWSVLSVRYVMQSGDCRGKNGWSR